MGIENRYMAALTLLAVISAASASAQDPSAPPARIAPLGLQSVIDTALDDAMKHTGLAREELEVVSAAAVTWPDGSLGCPKPDVVYTQAPVPGYRVVVQAGDLLLNYHANEKGRAFLCPSIPVARPVPRETR